VVALSTVAAGVLALTVLSLLVGAAHLPPARVLDYLLAHGDARQDARLRLVVVTLRLPRTLAALIAGCALGVAGMLLQAATRNPLAETGLLGVNAGAALGIVLGLSSAGVRSGPGLVAWSLAGALVASAVVLAVAGTGGRSVSPLRLVLAGAAIGATLRGLTSYLLLRDQGAYDEFRTWILGSLATTSTHAALTLLPVWGAGLLVAAVSVRPLSALALGDEAARSLGHRPAAIRLVVAVAVTLLAGVAVALTGPIAFLGLLAPYAARAVAPARPTGQLVLCAGFGAAGLLGADVLSRVLFQPYETPVSVLIALVGAPLLIWIARSGRGGAATAVGAGS
jgi:iron complex transport system permease protein